MRVTRTFFKRLFLAGIIWTGGQAANAQSTNAQAAVRQSGLDMQTNITSLVKGLAASLPNGSAEMKGSPYVISQWLPGHITLSNKLTLQPVLLKYDVLHQRLLMRPDAKKPDSLQLKDQTIAQFILDESATALRPARPRIFQRFADAPEARWRVAFVEVLHEGRYALLKHYVKVLHAADFKSAYGNNQYDEVEDKQAYFLRRPDSSVVPVKLTLKSMLAAAPDLGPVLKQADTAKTDMEWAAALNAADPR